MFELNRQIKLFKTDMTIEIKILQFKKIKIFLSENNCIYIIIYTQLRC